MPNFNFSLPKDLLEALSEKASRLSMPKNKLIEKALRLYLDHLEKTEYIISYREASKDGDLLAMAEEGMGDYLKQLEDSDS